MPLEHTSNRDHIIIVLYCTIQHHLNAKLFHSSSFFMGQTSKYVKFLLAFCFFHVFASCSRPRFIKIMLIHIPFIIAVYECAFRLKVFIVETCFFALCFVQLTQEGEVKTAAFKNVEKL